ncbi:DUF2480 family protein [Capnocytophaga canimorsus]|uniref:DUF2480 family protein n=1 Tax=Capnocytophaga canimorsus TaxID=28188 RepID=UPI001EDF68EF|nr:DUF2480 family protein [Capnocytophaga canimorsus]GJQ03920.1 hypothetical protein CAPN009_03350 [Capnocytophaga canimorsus]
MSESIINRVANSSLAVFDLEDYYPVGQRMAFDLKDFLFEEIVLKEKDFRQQLDDFHWEIFKDAYVALFCSSEAIIPPWAYMLVTSKLAPYARKTVLGDLNHLEIALYQEIIERIDVSYLKDKPVIIKGCSQKPVPEAAYVMAVEKIQPIAKSVMYGEACSAVPIFKKKK